MSTGDVRAQGWRPDLPERVPWAAVVAFVLLACGLAWLVALPLWSDPRHLASPWAGLLLPAMMFTPALAALFVVLVLRTPRVHRVRFLGLWPLRPVGRTVGLAVIAVFGPLVLVVAATLLCGALGLVDLDLVGFSGYRQLLEHTLAAQGAPASALDALPPLGVLVASQLLAVPLGALINSFLTIGEELGWRGWLLIALRPLGTWPALLLMGVVWGLWHAPLILLGYNFSRPDLSGVALMVGGCVAWGVLLGWLRLRSASLWPPVLAHGALNAAAGVVLLLAAAGATPDLAVVGPLGLVMWGVLAVVVLVLVAQGQFRRQPAPLPPLPRRTSPPSSRA